MGTCALESLASIVAGGASDGSADGPASVVPEGRGAGSGGSMMAALVVFWILCFKRNRVSADRNIRSASVRREKNSPCKTTSYISMNQSLNDSNARSASKMH